MGSVKPVRTERENAKKLPEFTISHQAAFDNDNLIGALQFKKYNEQEMYFFNSYNLTLKNGQHQESFKQTFYISNEDSITL